MAISRDSVKPPVLPERAFACPALGGEVILRGPMASVRIALMRKAQGGASTLETIAPQVLAASVLDAEKQPLFSAEEWDTWGGLHYDAFIELFNAAYALWGGGEEPRKN